ncbi:MAG: hypothetical protein M9894_29660 [Planctomycetes bacterium]|nr:hypothetical protein [Planctomycetota bacterium]
MSDAMPGAGGPARPLQADEVVRWGLRADALGAEAARRGAEVEDRLGQGIRAVERAVDAQAAAPDALEGAEEQARRIEEIARETGKAAVRSDLLALNVQVEAARLGEEEQGLEKVGDDLRRLADQTTRGAHELEALASGLLGEVTAARRAWAQGAAQLEAARAQLEWALRAAEEAGLSLSEARGAAAAFSAAAAARGERGERGWDEVDVETASRLAAAAEVRDETINRLARAVAGRLQRTGEELEREAAAAADVGRRLDELERHLRQQRELVGAADEVARRSKQLAVNADLAAARATDPAFALFAEEARRLSEHAENAAAQGQVQLAQAHDELTAARELARRHAEAAGRLARETTELLSRFAEAGQGEDPIEGLASAWRDDRVAARLLTEARASWHRSNPTPPAP